MSELLVHAEQYISRPRGVSVALDLTGDVAARIAPRPRLPRAPETVMRLHALVVAAHHLQRVERGVVIAISIPADEEGGIQEAMRLHGIAW